MSIEQQDQGISEFTQRLYNTNGADTAEALLAVSALSRAWHPSTASPEVS